MCAGHMHYAMDQTQAESRNQLVLGKHTPPKKTENSKGDLAGKRYIRRVPRLNSREDGQWALVWVAQAGVREREREQCSPCECSSKGRAALALAPAPALALCLLV